jgi:pentatricopeptide repeat protein
MATVGVAPNTISYSAAISACEKGMQWKEALRLLRDMASKGVQPNTISYSAAISACETCHKWKEGLILLAEMHSKGIKPDKICLGAAMSACVTDEQRDEVSCFIKNTMGSSFVPERTIKDRKPSPITSENTSSADASAMTCKLSTSHRPRGAELEEPIAVVEDELIKHQDKPWFGASLSPVDMYLIAGVITIILLMVEFAIE